MIASRPSYYLFLGLLRDYINQLLKCGFQDYVLPILFKFQAVQFSY